MPSQAKPSQAKPSQAKLNQSKPSHLIFLMHSQAPPSHTSSLYSQILNFIGKIIHQFFFFFSLLFSSNFEWSLIWTVNFHPFDGTRIQPVIVVILEKSYSLNLKPWASNTNFNICWKLPQLKDKYMQSFHFAMNMYKIMFLKIFPFKKKYMF